MLQAICNIFTSAEFKSLQQLQPGILLGTQIISNLQLHSTERAGLAKNELDFLDFISLTVWFFKYIFNQY